MAFAITGTADQIAELLCGPRQHDEHMRGYRWHLYVRDDAKRVAAVNAELRKMIAERREAAERRAAAARADLIEALAAAE